MMACRSEGHAQGATVLFAGLNYGLQVWPWIVTALCSLVLLGPLPDPEMGYPRLMAVLLPSGLLGLLVVTLLGAFMSTVDTHLNLGASYVVNDLYQRFVRRDAAPAHYVRVSRLSMVALLAVSIGVAMSIESIGDAWKFILSFAAGAGLVWIVRWFWWRVNAWSEIAAMLTSGVVSTALVYAAPDMIYTDRLLWVVGVSTVVWLAVTFATAPVDDATLVRFIRRVRPGSPGWAALRARHGIAPEPFLGRAVVDWLLGTVALFAANFGIGSALFADAATAAALFALALAAAGLLIFRLQLARRSSAISTGEAGRRS